LEVDILPITDDNNTTIELSDLIVGVAGELSPFEQTHGFSIDGVDLTTAALPDGWRGRLIKVQNANTAVLPWQDAESTYYGPSSATRPSTSQSNSRPLDKIIEIQSDEFICLASQNTPSGDTSDHESTARQPQ
jgi:hypothetical protein